MCLNVFGFEFQALLKTKMRGSYVKGASKGFGLRRKTMRVAQRAFSSSPFASFASSFASL